MRIFTGSLATETNTFAPMPTGLSSFQDRGYYPAGQHPDQMQLFSGPLWAARQRGREQGWDLIEGMTAGAQPSGITTRHCYESLRDELLADLQRAMPVDVVLLGLHGAMVADGYDDCEGDLLTRVRDLVGPNVVVGAELDPHSHMTATMVAHADLLITFKEYPHTDVLERGLELVDMCVAMAQGRIRPVAALVDCHMIATLHTTCEPARGFVDRIQALEGQGGVLSISVVHGFAWGDVRGMGTKLLVYADGLQDMAAAKAQAQATANQLASELVHLREALSPPSPGIDEAIDQALAHPAGPVVLADGADNPGGGAAGDATFILRRLLERGVQNVAMAPLWDPGAVRIAMDAGVGATLALRLGGKISPLSGDPVDLRCTVKALQRDMHTTGLAGTPAHLGDCAWVQGEGIDIVLISVRNQAIHPDMFTRLGIDLAQRKMVVVKSSQHFHAAYAPLAAGVIYVQAPGAVSHDLRTLPYSKIQRPKWPVDPLTTRQILSEML